MIPWDHYTTSMRVDRLTGGIPANPKMLQAWLEANGAPADAATDQTEMLKRLDPEETHAVVFYRDAKGVPCYESRAFKAALKEAANILKGEKLLDVKSFRSKLAERVFVGPRLLPLPADRIHVAERPISVMTQQGPRTSIKRFEFVENVELTFHLKVLRDGIVTLTHLQDLLEYLQDNGIGADRSQGSGTFELLEFKPMSPAEADIPEPVRSGAR